ncbi:hypothetical protein PsAD2_03031 [Pseudovibrio axinellae]|uniref:Phage tail protein (Tail_P2_I) n=1 Tax=Pseudovibrio axinellae TaxID=989403 RepID=A0A165XGZ5_9HYPH|nr:hypothetical protein [Pseudovibrio axinellae]KZL17694.1 hypothetical protein PsAD2_03031 [Pseudovibrio axinellae]SER43333.1 hypothetical protein SAMN05421798_11050 [Pseudovibrio axinellae]
MSSGLTPQSAELWVRLVGKNLQSEVEQLRPHIENMGMKWANPQPRIMPHLIEETGLGMLSPYVDNVYELYDDGLEWLRIRGFEAAVYKGLGFIGYGGTLEVAPSRRRKWHWDQLALDRLPITEADLPRVAGVARLSVSRRTKVARVFRGYDIRALELSYSKLGSTILSAHSGVRVGEDQTKWSFGQYHEIALALDKATQQALGIHIDGGDGLSWDDLTVPWEGVDVPWEDLGAGTAQRFMAGEFVRLGGYLGFYREDGSLIGARRFKITQQVSSETTTYQINGEKVGPDPAGQRVFIEALTGFGNGAGEELHSIALLMGAKPVVGLPQAQSWLLPDQIVTPIAPVLHQPLAFEFQHTRRERIKLLLSFS